MLLLSFLKNHTQHQKRPASERRRNHNPLYLETLEARALLTTGFSLVTQQPAPVLDSLRSTLNTSGIVAGSDQVQIMTSSSVTGDSATQMDLSATDPVDPTTILPGIWPTPL